MVYKDIHFMSFPIFYQLILNKTHTLLIYLKLSNSLLNWLVINCCIAISCLICNVKYLKYLNRYAKKNHMQIVNCNYVFIKYMYQLLSSECSLGSSSWVFTFVYIWISLSSLLTSTLCIDKKCWQDVEIKRKIIVVCMYHFWT